LLRPAPVGVVFSAAPISELKLPSLCPLRVLSDSERPATYSASGPLSCTVILASADGWKLPAMTRFRNRESRLRRGSRAGRAVHPGPPPWSRCGRRGGCPDRDTEASESGEDCVGGPASILSECHDPRPEHRVDHLHLGQGGAAGAQERTRKNARRERLKESEIIKRFAAPGAPKSAASKT
jgi:hypothetical protein